MAPVISLQKPTDPVTPAVSEEVKVFCIVFFCILATVSALLMGFISLVCIPLPHYPPPQTKTNICQICLAPQPDEHKDRYWKDTEANLDPISGVRNRPRQSKAS